MMDGQAFLEVCGVSCTHVGGGFLGRAVIATSRCLPHATVLGSSSRAAARANVIRRGRALPPGAGQVNQPPSPKAPKKTNCISPYISP